VLGLAQGLALRRLQPLVAALCRQIAAEACARRCSPASLGKGITH
jgi:hypothetical protein